MLESAPNASAKPKNQQRSKVQRTKFQSTIPLHRLNEPWYSDMRCPHNIICGLNKTTEVTTEQLNKPSIWNSTYPTTAFEGVLSDVGEDLVVDLVKQKKRFIAKMNQLKSLYRRKRAGIEADKKQLSDNAHSTMIQRFAEYRETDPDKYFSGYYNWYFTGGGGMDIVNLHDQDYLIHSVGTELEHLRISKLNYDDGVTISPTNTYDNELNSFNRDKTIYEIKAIVNEPYFTVRQKHTLSVLHLNEETLKLHKIHSDVPLVTSAVDASKKLIVIDAKQHLQLFNLLDDKPLSQVDVCENEMTIDNWTNVRFIEQNQFLCANRQNISVYDVRQPISQPVIRHNFTSSMSECEDLTCIEHSNNSHNTLIATTHKILVVDLRNYKDEKMPTFTWTHQLKTSPIMIDIIEIDDRSDLIAICGVKSGDVKICDTETTEDVTISCHLPYTPRSVHDSLNYAKNHGKLLEPNCMFQHQIKLSNTGIKLKKINANKFSLLTKNSSGDIFVQDILRKQENDSEIPEPDIAKMDIWNKKRHVDYEVTDVTNFDRLAAFLGSNMHKKLEENVVEPPEPSIQPWQMSIQELASYQDVLASSLLDKWVIDEDVEMDEKYTDQRMNDWVDSTVENYHVEVFHEDICVKSEEEIQEYTWTA